MNLKDKSSYHSKAILRKKILKELLDGKVDIILAAEQLSISVRQVYRLISKVKKSGLNQITHGNKGRTPANKIQDEKWDEILNLIKGEYETLSIYQLQETLARNHQIKIGRESLRKKLRDKQVRSTQNSTE